VRGAGPISAHGKPTRLSRKKKGFANARLWLYMVAGESRVAVEESRDLSEKKESWRQQLGVLHRKGREGPR